MFLPIIAMGMQQGMPAAEMIAIANGDTTYQGTRFGGSADHPQPYTGAIPVQDPNEAWKKMFDQAMRGLLPENKPGKNGGSGQKSILKELKDLIQIHPYGNQYYLIPQI